MFTMSLKVQEFPSMNPLDSYEPCIYVKTIVIGLNSLRWCPAKASVSVKCKRPIVAGCLSVSVPMMHLFVCKRSHDASVCM